MRLRLYLLLTLLSPVVAVVAQQATVVKGIVHHAGTGFPPAVGYQIRAINGNANTAYTNGDGVFTLVLTNKEPGDKIVFSVSKKINSGSYAVVKTVETYIPKSDMLEIILQAAQQQPVVTAHQAQQNVALLNGVLQLNQENLRRRDSLDRAEQRLKEKMQFIDSISKNVKASALGQDAILALQQTKNYDSALKVLSNVDLEKEYQTFMQQQAAAEASIKKTIETYKLKIQLLTRAKEWYDESTSQQLIQCNENILKIYLENKFDTSEISYQYIAIAIGYKDLNKISKALDYCLEGIAFANKSEKHKAAWITLYNYAAGYFLELGDCSNAIQYQRTFIKELLTLHACKTCAGSINLSSIFHDELANIYSECGQFSQAVETYRQSLNLNKLIQYEQGYYKDYSIYEKMAHVYYKIGDTVTAQHYLDSATQRFSINWYGVAANKILHYLKWQNGWQHLNKPSLTKAYNDSITQLIATDSLLSFKDMAPYITLLKKDFQPLHQFLLSHNQAFNYTLLTDTINNKSINYLVKLYERIWESYKKTSDSASGVLYGRILDTLENWQSDYHSLAKDYDDLSTQFSILGNNQRAIYFMHRQLLVSQQLYGPTDSLQLRYLETLGNFLQDNDTKQALDIYLQGYSLLKKSKIDSAFSDFLITFFCQQIAHLYEQANERLQAIPYVLERHRHLYKTMEPSESLAFELGRLNFESGKYKEATEHWRYTIQLNGKSKSYSKLARLYCNQGNAFSLNGEIDSAAKYAQQALDFYRRTSQTNQSDLVKHLSILHIIVGEHFIQRNNYKKATQFFAAAKTLETDTISMIAIDFQLSKSYMAQGELAKGDALLKAATAKTSPALINHYYQQIIPHLIRQRHFAKAQSLLETCQRNDSSNMALPYFWATFYAQQGQKDKALAYFTTYAGIGKKYWAPDMGSYYLKDPLLVTLRKEKTFIALCNKIDEAGRQ